MGNVLTLLLAAASLAPSSAVPLAPLGSLITSSDYPAGAMQRGVTGRVGFRLRLDATGKPDGCVVSQTSGSVELDNATCDLMLARARFKPALEPGGEPVRGDYSARVVWAIDEQPEAVTSEVIQVRSELDGSGKVISCTVVPAEAAVELGGCASFGDPRMLGHLTGRPLTGFAWVEMRMIKQVSTDAPIVDPVPAGAIRSVLAKSTVAITPAGIIGSCTSETVTQFDGRPIDLCVIGLVEPRLKFSPAATTQPRQLTMTMETVAQPR